MLERIWKIAVGGIMAIWGTVPIAVTVLAGVMVLDILTGILASAIEQKINSDVSYAGMLRKAIVLCVVGMTAIIEFYLRPHANLPLSELVAGFYIAHEAMSILENAVRAKLQVPKVLVAVLDQLKERGDEGTTVTDP